MFKGIMNRETKIHLIFWHISGHCTINTSCNFNIYAFIRRFYPKRLTVHSGYTFFVSMRKLIGKSNNLNWNNSWELNSQAFVLQMQCFTTEPQERRSFRTQNFVISLKTDYI